MSKDIGKIGNRVIDISNLVSVFEAQEGIIEQVTGKTGNGKTYEGTRRALEFLRQGYSVYTTWKLILPEYYDEREDKSKLFWRTLFFRKTFYKFDYKKNWHWIDIDRPDLVEFVAKLTDCVVFLDEGQDIFDSYEGTGMSKIKRKSLTRTRHMRKTLIIISQRANAVHVTARANITFFYRCVKTVAWFWPFKPYFRVFRTEDMDNQNLPVWENEAEDIKPYVWHSHFAKQEIYDSYNSWYLRAGIPKSQEIKFEAYNLKTLDKIKLLFTKVEKKKIMLNAEEEAKLAAENLKKYTELTTFNEKEKKPRSKSSKKVIPTLSTQVLQPSEKVVEFSNEQSPENNIKLSNGSSSFPVRLNEYEKLWGKKKGEAQDGAEKPRNGKKKLVLNSI